jgi:hypothetical protein
MYCCTDEIYEAEADEIINLAITTTRVEAGSNTSTVNLRVVRGDEMELKKAAP